MADPISIACAAAQFLGLAAQAVDGISSLRRKFVEIKGAPRLIRGLNSEIRAIQNTFREISSIEQHVPEESHANFIELSEQCADTMQRVYDILVKYDIRKGDPRMKRLWKSIAASEGRPELEELLRGLERSKTALVAFLSGVNVQMTRAVQSQLAAHAAVVEPSLERIETNLSVISTRSENIYSKTLQIEENIEESSAKIMKHMDEVARRMCDDMPRLVEDGFQKCLERATRDVRAFDSRDSTTDMVPPRLSGLKETKAISNTHSFQALQTDYCTSEPSSHSLRLAYKKRTFCKTFPLPIGFIQTKATRSKASHAPTMSTESEESTLHIEISLIPFRWLSSHGQVISLKKISTHVSGFVWNICLRSYNVIPPNAMIIQASKNQDLEAIQMLFKYQQASPFDVDAAGCTLMSHAWNIEHSAAQSVIRARKGLEILKFLITQGADPAPYVHELLGVYRYFGRIYAFYDMGDLASEDDQGAVMKAMDAMLRLCLEHSQADPFTETKALLSLWQNSLGGETVPPLDSSYLFQEDLAGLDDLVFELPDQVFYDIMLKRSIGSGSDESWIQLINQSYEALVYLCRGGKNSIKSKVFASSFARSVSRLDGSRSCYCTTNATHLLFLALHDAHLLSRWTVSRVKCIRKHVRRMLVELLTSGEDPEARCACRTSWQSTTGYRTVTDVAAAEGLLGVWEGALEECGFDAARIIDEERYGGLSSLFDMPQSDSSNRAAPLKVVGQVLYSTISSFV